MPRGRLPGARARAKLLGERLYMPEAPCCHGHLTLRRTSNGACLACERRRDKQRSQRRHQERYQANPERERQRAASYRLKNPEKIKAYDKEHYAKNAEREKADSKRYRELNHERTLETQRLWKINNPEKWRVAWTNAKSRRRGAEGKFSQQDVIDLMTSQKGQCVYCKEDIKAKYHIDHITPISRGGTNYRNNLQLLCPFCNISKNNRDPVEYAQSRGFLL